MDTKLRKLEKAALIDAALWRPLAITKERTGDERGYNLANAMALRYELGEIKVIDLQINWMDKYANSPYIQVLLNRMPDNKEFVYRTSEECPALHFAETGPICSYFSYVRPGDGYGGHRFNLLMENGSFKELIGPYSSGSYAMNKQGFGPCIEVSATACKTVMAVGHTFRGSSIRIDAILPFLKEKGLGLCLMKSYTYQVTSKKKYPACGPYYNKGANSPSKNSSFNQVQEEILAPE